MHSHNLRGQGQLLNKPQRKKVKMLIKERVALICHKLKRNCHKMKRTNQLWNQPLLGLTLIKFLKSFQLALLQQLSIMRELKFLTRWMRKQETFHLFCHSQITSVRLQTLWKTHTIDGRWSNLTILVSQILRKTRNSKKLRTWRDFLKQLSLRSP